MDTETLPRFLIASSLQDPEDREFILHTHNPRFMAVVRDLVEDEEPDISPAGVVVFDPPSIIEVIEWYDQVQQDDLDAGLMAGLMREMGEWYVDEKTIEQEESLGEE